MATKHYCDRCGTERRAGTDLLPVRMRIGSEFAADVVERELSEVCPSCRRMLREMWMVWMTFMQDKGQNAQAPEPQQVIFRTPRPGEEFELVLESYEITPLAGCSMQRGPFRFKGKIATPGKRVEI